jgi:hypothetical protein
MELPGKSYWAVLVVSLAAALPYLGTLGSYFIGDDFGYIQLYGRESFPTNPLSLFWSDWSQGIWGFHLDEIRPLMALSYFLESRWGAASPTAYHASNVIVHVLNSLVVLGIGRVAGLSLLAATFAGSLFGVLAIHGETVSWIGGRADLHPALLYLLTVLAYALWRRNGARWLYGVALAAFFLALFSKQSTIVMVGTLVLYDAFVAHRPLRRSPSRVWPDVSFVLTGSGEPRCLRFSLAHLRPYVPFVVMTIGFLAVRQVLFQTMVREDSVSLSTVLEYGHFQATQLQILVFGSRVIHHRAVDGLVWVALALVLLIGIAELINLRKHVGRSPRAVAFYFGALWWLLNTTPLLVTYLTARHLYLAAVGPVIAVGVLVDALWSRRRASWRIVAMLAGVGLILASGTRLQLTVGDWSEAASVSQKVVLDAERELSAAPTGSLFVLDTPPETLGSATQTWLWSWVLPFALQPPFTDVDLTERVFVIEPLPSYCCLDWQWLEKTRANVEAWARRADEPPVIILRWNAATGAMIRQSAEEDPSLRSRVMALASANSVPEMCAQFNSLLVPPGEARNVCELVGPGWYLGVSPQDS